MNSNTFMLPLSPNRSRLRFVSFRHELHKRVRYRRVVVVVKALDAHRAQHRASVGALVHRADDAILAAHCHAALWLALRRLIRMNGYYSAGMHKQK